MWRWDKKKQQRFPFLGSFVEFQTSGAARSLPAVFYRWPTFLCLVFQKSSLTEVRDEEEQCLVPGILDSLLLDKV